MINKLRTGIIFVALSCYVIGFFGVSVPAGAQANLKPKVCGGAELSVANSTSCPGAAAAEKNINTLIANIVNVLSIIVGIVAVIMIILGGFKYITSGGDSGSISSAKTTIIYAIVGLVIVTLAQVIVRFVLTKAT